MKRTILIMLVVGVLTYVVNACLGQALSEPPKTLRVLRAENKLLRAQVQALRERVKALTDENARLKATPKRERITALEAKLGKLKAENAKLKARLKGTPTSLPTTRKSADVVKTRPFIARATKGPVRVTAASAEIRKIVVWNKLTEKKGTSKDKLLGILVAVRNLSETQKLHYRTWGADASKMFGSSASVVDNLGNKYKPIHFGRLDAIVGRTDDEYIYPGKGMIDILVFEVPIAKAKTLILSLPLKNVGGSGTVQLRIPVKRIRRH